MVLCMVPAGEDEQETAELRGPPVLECGEVIEDPKEGEEREGRKFAF